MFETDEVRVYQAVFKGNGKHFKNLYSKLGVDVDLVEGNVYSFFGYRRRWQVVSKTFEPFIALIEYKDKVYKPYFHPIINDEFQVPMLIRNQSVMFPASFFEYEGKPLSLRKLKKLFS